MKRIEISEKKKKNLLVLGVAFVVLFLTYSVFLNHSFTSDHVNTYFYYPEGYKAIPPLNPFYYIKTTLGLTAIPMWINYFFAMIGITKDTHQYILQLFAMLLIAYAVRLLFAFYESFFPEKEKKVVLLVILLLAFINPYFCEVFVYVGYDKIFGIIAAIFGSILFSKKRYIWSFVCVLLAVTGYQIYYVLFLAYTGTWIFLNAKGKFQKEAVWNYIKMYLVMLVPTLMIVFAYVLYSVGNVGSYVGKAIALGSNLMERMECVRRRYHELMVTQQGLLPRYFLAICFVVMVILCLLFLKEKKVKDILFTIFHAICLSLYPVTIYFVATNASFSGRIIWCVFAGLSGIGLVALQKVDLKNWTGKVMGTILVLIYCINIYSVSSTITNFYISNALDSQIVGQVVAQIENYERDTGISVQKIAAAANRNSKCSYPQVGFLGMDYSNEDAGYYNFTHKAMDDPWADAELFLYLTKRPYSIVEMDPDIWAEHFEGRIWETFNPQEQLYFEGDTVYWCIY